MTEDSNPEELGASIGRTLSRLWSVPVTVQALRPFGDGHSGFTYLLKLESAGRSDEYVARLSPPGARIAGPADVGRQGRLMASLHQQGLPVPQVVAADSSGMTLGRALVVMHKVEGTGWQAATEEQGDYKVASAAVRFLHRLGTVNLGLLDIGSEQPVSLHDELDRWRRLLRYCPGWLSDSCQRLYSALREAPPVPGPVRLVHGDFHYGNMLFHQARILGVVDWEIATLSDQRLDLGCLAVASLRRHYPDPNPTGGLKISLRELAEMYGMPLAEARWFTAASCLKYAAILGYNLGLHRSGRRVDMLYEHLQTTMRRLARDGMQLLHGDDVLS